MHIVVWLHLEGVCAVFSDAIGSAEPKLREGPDIAGLRERIDDADPVDGERIDRPLRAIQRIGYDLLIDSAGLDAKLHRQRSVYLVTGRGVVPVRQSPLLVAG
jgi:hypothetical protein